MSIAVVFPPEKSRLRALLDHFAVIDDPREPWRVAHPLPEILLLVVCGTIADCDDYEGIAEWGEAHLPFLRRFLPYHHGVPGARWLTILMNRIDPDLFAAAFTAWVRETWPDRPAFVAIDGTSHRSHDRATGTPPLHGASAGGAAPGGRHARSPRTPCPSRAACRPGVPAPGRRGDDRRGGVGGVLGASPDAVAVPRPRPGRRGRPRRAGRPVPGRRRLIEMALSRRV